MKVKGIKVCVDSSNVKFLTPLSEVMERVRMLNSDQRIIFDDLMERLWCNREDKKPFHVYISGEAGTGKSFLMKTLIEAAKHLSIKSGTPLDRSPVLVLCPTATSAGIVGGETIESALKMFKGNSLNTPVMNFSDEGSLSYKLEHLALIFFEEVSMVGCKKFQNIHS